jgi:hypothetical protein
VPDVEFTDEQTSRIRAMHTGISVSFDHRDPKMVTQIGRVDLPEPIASHSRGVRRP